MLQRINWFDLLKFSTYHKNTTLWWKNIKKLSPDTKIPKYLNDILQCIYNGINQRNEYYQKEISRVLFVLKENNIVSIPVKGAMLIPEMYKDFGLRYSGDADFLIKHEDVGKLEVLLSKELGYVKGEYSEKSDNVEPLSRQEEIKWRIYMSNLFPYYKLVKEDDLPLNYIKLDFRFALDDSLCYDTVNEIIDSYKKDGVVKPAHILTHLCTHFYGEAKYILTIELYKDLNLIKLCDIREYILNYVSKDDMNAMIGFAKKYNLEKAVYYTFHWLELVYNDGYENDILDCLDIDELEFLATFGKNINDDGNKFRHTELQRLFSCDNMEILNK